MRIVAADPTTATFTTVYDRPGGIAGYDFTAPTDVAVAFDPTDSGALGSLAFCRPGAGTVWIVLPQPQGPATFTRCLLADATLTGADLSGTDLSTIGAMQGAILTRANLRRATLTGVNLTGANIKGTDFTGCDLTTLVLGSPFDRPTDPDTPTIFADCTLPYGMLGLDWSCLDLSGATITGLPNDLTGLKAYGLRRRKGDFIGFVLDGADFSSATLDNAMFTEAKLRAHGTTPATFDGSRLMGASFTEAVLDRTRFTDAALGGVSQSAAAADFSYAFLSNCSFGGANLYGVLFVGATLLSGNILAGTTG